MINLVKSSQPKEGVSVSGSRILNRTERKENTKADPWSSVSWESQLRWGDGPLIALQSKDCLY
jgi:hypothetical protein